MTTTNPLTPPQDARTAPVIVGPWPTYNSFANLPERERWAVYGCAKRHRADLEALGFEMAEPYDQFVQRVTAELEI